MSLLATLSLFFSSPSLQYMVGEDEKGDWGMPKNGRGKLRGIKKPRKRKEKEKPGQGQKEEKGRW